MKDFFLQKQTFPNFAIKNIPGDYFVGQWVLGPVEAGKLPLAGKEVLGVCREIENKNLKILKQKR